MEIISILNQKGGVGKTSIVHNLGVGIALRGKKVLFLDLDPQSNLSFLLKANQELSSFDLFNGERITTEGVIQDISNYSVIASNTFLSSIINQINDLYTIKKHLDEVKNRFDYILIDTPPTLGALTLNALISSNKVIIPTDVAILSMQGIQQLAETIESVRNETHENIKIEGLLFNRYKERLVVSKKLSSIIEEISALLHTKVFKTKLRDSAAVIESQSEKQNLFTFAPKARITQDFNSLIDELLINGD